MVDLIRYEDLPCWYELNWDSAKTAFILNVHNDFIHAKGAISGSAPIVKLLKRGFQLKSFEGNFAADSFGFEGALKRIGQNNGFASFIGVIPEGEIKTDVQCSHCHGSRKDAINEDMDCLSCRGTGYKLESRMEGAYALSLTLETFFRFAFDPEQRTSAKIPQLMNVEMILSRRESGLAVGIGGEISRAFWTWMIAHGPDRQLKDVVSAMRAAWYKISPFYKLWHLDDDFSAEIREDGWMAMDCPGDRCGVFPSHIGLRPHQGYEFGCHNVDTVDQQLTLLAGLAALHTKARKDMQKGLTLL